MKKVSKNLSVSADTSKKLQDMSKKLLISQSIIFEILVNKYYERFNKSKILKDKDVLDVFTK